jgi:hypothetical protein
LKPVAGAFHEVSFVRQIRDMLRAYKTVQREAKLMKPFLLAMLFGLLLVAVVRRAD